MLLILTLALISCLLAQQVSLIPHISCDDFCIGAPYDLDLDLDLDLVIGGMPPFTRLSGVAVPMPTENIDTDQVTLTLALATLVISKRI